MLIYLNPNDLQEWSWFQQKGGGKAPQKTLQSFIAELHREMSWGVSPHPNPLWAPPVLGLVPPAPCPALPCPRDPQLPRDLVLFGLHSPGREIYSRSSFDVRP